VNDSNQPTNAEALQSEPLIINNPAEEAAVTAEAALSQATEVAVAKDAEGAGNHPESPAKAGAPGPEPSRGAQARPQRPERPERTEREKVERAEQRAERVAEATEVAEKAWKLYSGEIEEEGIELIDDSDAEKLAQRCFKIAEIFVKTRIRRLNQALNGGGGSQEENVRSGQNQGQRQNQPNQPKGGQGQPNQSQGQRQQNQPQGQKQGQRQNQSNQGKGGQNHGQNQPKRSEQPPAGGANPAETAAASPDDAALAPAVEKTSVDLPPVATTLAVPAEPEAPAAAAAE
jgi:hypothetical protein